jgi:hypothetical protein
MDLCGKIRPPLTYSSSFTITSSPRTDTFSILTWNTGKHMIKSRQVYSLKCTCIKTMPPGIICGHANKQSNIRCMTQLPFPAGAILWCNHTYMYTESCDWGMFSKIRTSLMFWVSIVFSKNWTLLPGFLCSCCSKELFFNFHLNDVIQGYRECSINAGMYIEMY